MFSMNNSSDISVLKMELLFKDSFVFFGKNDRAYYDPIRNVWANFLLHWAMLSHFAK